MSRARLPRRVRSTFSAFCLAVCFSAATGRAETGGVALSQVGLERWTPEVGLAGSWVTDIAEDRSGFLWIATAGGLSRFDGRAFRNFTAATEADLQASAMNAVAVGPDGRVWVGLEHGGVRAMGEDGLRRNPLVEGLPDVSVRTIAIDARGTLWIGTASGLWRSGPQGASLVPLAGDARTANVAEVVVAPDGAAWARTRNHGLWRVEGNAVERVPDAPGCVGLSLAFARDGRPVTSCVDGIWERDATGSGWVLASTAGHVQRLLVDREGTLWFESLDGLTRRFPDGRTERLAVEEGVGDVRIRALFEDSRGEMWVGTFSAGLSRLRRGAARAFGPDAGLPRGDSTGVAVDASGDLWVGTHNAGLFRWRLGRGVVGRWSMATGLPSDRVLAVAPDPRHPGRVWIGTVRGIAELSDGNVRRVDRPEGRTEETVTILYADPASPGTVWAAGTGNGADEIRSGAVLRHGEANGLRAGRIRAFLRERSGLLLAGGDGGLFRYDGTLWHDVAPGGEGVRDLRAVVEAEDGTLWLASSSSGLLRFSSGRLVRFGEREGLPFNRVYSVEFDGSGGLWLSGDEGLVRLRVDDVDRWARGELEAVPAARLSARDGLRDRECNGWGRPASCRLPDGTLVYPTIGGVALVDPSRLPGAELSPAELYFDGAFTGSRALAVRGPLRLGSDERDLRLRFGCVEFEFPESVLYRYRLEGLDEKWVSAGTQREAAYSYLPPGSYHFRLQARLPGQPWVEAALRPAVVVAPALRESGWFRALAAALALLAGIALLSWRSRVQRAHAAELAVGREELRRLASALLKAQEEERARLARELHDDFTQRLAGLAMLAGGYSQALRKGAVPNLERGLEEVGRELEKLAADSQALSRELHPSLLENVGLDGALRAECATFGSRTGLRIDYESRQVPGDLPPEVGIVLYRIAQEALRNVVSHSGSPEARVTLAGDASGLELSIEDSGAGFDPGRRSEGAGLGLASMAERSRLIGARLEIDSAPGNGTRIRVRVPHPTRQENGSVGEAETTSGGRG